MSTHKSVVDPGRANDNVGTAPPQIMLVSNHPNSQDYTDGNLAERFNLDTVSTDEVDGHFAFDSIDFVLIDGTTLDSEDRNLEELVRSLGFGGPIGIISTGNAREFAADEFNTESLQEPVDERDLVDLVERLIQRERYIELVKMDFQITYELSTLQVETDGDTLETSHNIGSLVEQKRKIRAVIQEIQQGFDNRDFLAVFEAGFDDVDGVTALA